MLEKKKKKKKKTREKNEEKTLKCNLASRRHCCPVEGENHTSLRAPKREIIMCGMAGILPCNSVKA
jgi:hypothetical protein